jgi:RNase H-fold protein (predicted Holliday junction resolvase)
MKDEQFEWREQRKLLKQVVRVEGSCGNYSILSLSNGLHAVLDRSNSKFLLSSSGSLYILPDDWKQWFKRGFVVIAFPRSLRYSKYYILSAKSRKFIAKMEKIEVVGDEFLEEKSDYFIAGNKRIGYAVYDKDGQQISGWYNRIDPFGLVEGESDYYIARTGKKEAIFHKNGQQISNWYKLVYLDGLVKGESGYYIARKGNKRAIFHEDGHQISDWFDVVYPYGLVRGESDYYIVKKNDKYAIFHKDGKQFTDWYDVIYSVGLVEGQTDYYIAKRNKFYYVCKWGSSKMLGPFKGFVRYGFILDPSPNEIKVETSENQYVTFTKQEAEEFFEEKEIEDE